MKAIITHRYFPIPLILTLLFLFPQSFHLIAQRLPFLIILLKCKQLLSRTVILFMLSLRYLLFAFLIVKWFWLFYARCKILIKIIFDHLFFLSILHLYIRCMWLVSFKAILKSVHWRTLVVGSLFALEWLVKGLQRTIVK